MLDATVQEVTDTIEELREIAHGIRPGILDDGLASALRDLVQRTPLPVSVPYRIGGSPGTSRQRRTSLRAKASPTPPSTQTRPASTSRCVRWGTGCCCG